MKMNIMKASFFGIFFSTSFLFSGCVFDSSFLSHPGPYLKEQDACGFAVDEYSGEGLRWKKTKFPIVFKVHANVPDRARDNFVSAVSHWNLAWYDFLEEEGIDQTFDLFDIDRSGVYEGDAVADGSNLFMFVPKDFSRYEDERAQAITALWSNRRNFSIIDTDILVNDEAFDFHYDASYNRSIDLAMQKFEKKRHLASLRSPGRFAQIREKIKSFFSLFLHLFRKEKPMRQIANYRVSVPAGKVDFPSLMVHELGHVPGRGHFRESEFHAYSRSRNPSSHDYHSPSSHDYHSHSSEDEQKHSSHNHRENRSPQSGRTLRSRHISVMEPFLQQGRARRQITEYDLENLFCAYYNY